MSVGKVSPASRSVLRFHGWLLMAWVALVGLVTSAVLLHVFHVYSMALRYALGSAAIYFAGFVLGGWWYAHWWHTRKFAATHELPVHATPQEQLAYDSEQEKLQKRFSGFDLVGDLGGGDDPISAILAIIGVIFVLVMLVFLAGYLPMIVTDLMAGYLAEIVLEFVIGAVIVRRVMRPKPLDGVLGHLLRNTWLAGLFMVVVFGALGFALQQMDPGAITLLQFFR